MPRILSFLCVFVIVPLSKILAKVPVLFLVYNAGEGEPFREVAKKLTVDFAVTPQQNNYGVIEIENSPANSLNWLLALACKAFWSLIKNW